MNKQKLILMAENICANFGSYPKEQQIKQTVNHIQQFWTPEMRQQLKQGFDDSTANTSPLLQTITKQI